MLVRCSFACKMSFVEKTWLFKFLGDEYLDEVLENMFLRKLDVRGMFARGAQLTPQ